MIKHASLLVVAAVVALAPIVPAFAQSKDALTIANNDSVLIDAKSFKILPGNAEGDAAALIKKLDAKDMGPGAIVFRSGGKLYMVAATADQQRFGSDRYGSNRYGSDRYGSDRYGSDRYGSDRYGSDRYGSDRYGSDRYGSDRYGSDRPGVVINDPDYAQYKLKKSFEDNWTTSSDPK
jgi:hypothetical protein